MDWTLIVQINLSVSPTSTIPFLFYSIVNEKFLLFPISRIWMYIWNCVSVPTTKSLSQTFFSNLIYCWPNTVHFLFRFCFINVCVNQLRARATVAGGWVSNQVELFGRLKTVFASSPASSSALIDGNKAKFYTQCYHWHCKKCRIHCENSGMVYVTVQQQMGARKPLAKLLQWNNWTSVV